MTKEVLKNIDDLQDTMRVAKAIAEVLVPGLIIYLKGNLGVGKTTLTQYLLASLGYEGRVKSPTYTIVEPYSLPKMSIYHFDCYRLSSPEELIYLGIEDYIHETAILLVEWPEKGVGVLPQADIECEMALSRQQRTIKLSSHTDKGGERIEALKCHMQQGS